MPNENLDATPGQAGNKVIVTRSANMFYVGLMMPGSGPPLQVRMKYRSYIAAIGRVVQMVPDDIGDPLTFMQDAETCGLN